MTPTVTVTNPPAPASLPPLPGPGAVVLGHLPIVMMTAGPGRSSPALAAGQRQGKGPPSPVGWRGRERNTKYRSQS